LHLCRAFTPGRGDMRYAICPASFVTKLALHSIESTMIRRQARERTVALLVVAVVAVVAVALAAVVLTDNRTVRALLSRLVRLLLVSPLAARMPRRRMQRRRERACLGDAHRLLRTEQAWVATATCAQAYVPCDAWLAASAAPLSLLPGSPAVCPFRCSRVAGRVPSR
jgi:hypothetical protein